MGQCLEGESSYQLLRKSLVGSLFSTESDYADFYAICRTEVHTISSNLSITPSTAFYMVITGEVQVTLSRGDTKPISARTVKPGELINFFHGNKSCTVNGAMVYDKVELGLQYRSKDTLTRVIGADYDAIEKFLNDHPHLTALKALYEVNLCDFLTLPAFDTIDPAQMKIFGPLLKLKHVNAGQVITSNQPTNTRFDSSSTLLQSEFKEKKSNHQALNPIGLLLIGSCLAVPSMQLLEVIDHINQGKKRRVVDHIKEAIGIRGSESSSFTPSTESDVDSCLNKYSEQLNTELTRIYPGSLFGLEHYFAKNCNMALDCLMALETGLVGYIELETFHMLCKIDRRFKRVILRNFNRSLLDAIKPMIPLLNDMDEKHYTVLTYLISLACYDTNAPIFSKGSPSDYSYIVVRGTIKEITTPDPPELPPPQDGVDQAPQEQAPPNPPPDLPETVRLMGYGNFFGEVSLVTGTPYFTTTSALEPTTLIRISKRAFDHIYNNDRISLAELRIRMIGHEIEMQHIINHPRGNDLFAKFCDKELAGENIRFLNDAARYKDICDRLKKEMWSVINQNLLNNIISVDDNKENPNGISNSDSADSSKDNFFQTAPPSNKTGIKLSRQYSDRVVNRTFPVPNQPKESGDKESKESSTLVNNIEEKRLTASNLNEVNQNSDLNNSKNDEQALPSTKANTPSSKSLFTSQQEQKFMKNIEEIKEVAKMILDRYIRPNSPLEINIPAIQKKKILAIFEMVINLPPIDCLKMLQQVVYEMKVIVPRINSDLPNTHHPSNKNHVNMNTPTIPENEEVAAQLILLPNQNDLYPMDSPSYAHSHENTDGADPHNLRKTDSGNFQSHQPNPGYSSRTSTMTSKKDKNSFEHPVELLKGVPSDFFDLFRCAQYEIYKLLKNDKFFRWKKTKEFEEFIASVKPYEHNPNEGPTARYTRLIRQTSASGITFKGDSIFASQKTPFDPSVKESGPPAGGGGEEYGVSGLGKSLYMMISPRTSGGMNFYVTADRQGRMRSSVYRAPDEGSNKNHAMPPPANGHGHQLQSIPDNKLSNEDQALVLECKTHSNNSPSKQGGSLFSWLKSSNPTINNKVVPNK